jgi:hypothetical protein
MSSVARARMSGAKGLHYICTTTLGTFGTVRPALCLLSPVGTYRNDA